MAEEDEDNIDIGAEGAGEGVTSLDDEGSGGFGLKKILMIVIPVLLIGVGAALYFLGVFDPAPEEGTHAEAGAEGGGEHGEGVEAPHVEGLFMEIPDLLVNLSTSGGPPRFLKLKVKLEVSSPEDLASLEVIAPRVVDQFQTFLREMRVQDMRGSSGIYRLRQELLYRVNLAARPVKVKDILFQEILIQ